MTPSHVSDLVNISRDIVSLDTPVYSEKDSSELADFIEDTGYKLPEDLVIEESMKNDINSVLDTLTKESDILQYRFGLNGKGYCLSKILETDTILQKKGYGR